MAAAETELERREDAWCAYYSILDGLTKAYPKGKEVKDTHTPAMICSISSADTQHTLNTPFRQRE